MVDFAENSPLVSIVIPTYNQENFIAEAIGGALRQTYRNLQIIVADDASIDETLNLAKNFALHDTRVEVLETAQNLGITNNARRCVPYIKGKYVVWFAGDDIMYPQKIARQVEALESDSRAALCYHNTSVFDSARTQVLFSYNDWLIGQRAFEGDIVAPLLLYRCFISGTSAMVRASCMCLHDPRIAAASDWLMFIETARQGATIYIPEILGAYRRHAANVTARKPCTREEMLTYDIVGAQMPQMENAIARGKARMLLNYGFKYLLKGDLKASAGSLMEMLILIREKPDMCFFLIRSFGAAFLKTILMPLSPYFLRHRRASMYLKRYLDTLKE